MSDEWNTLREATQKEAQRKHAQGMFGTCQKCTRIKMEHDKYLHCPVGPRPQGAYFTFSKTDVFTPVYV